MKKHLVSLLIFCTVFLPACKQVPRIKTVPKISQNEYRLESSSNDIKAFAQPLTKLDARQFIGFTPKPHHNGHAWLLTLENNSSDAYVFYIDSWYPQRISNDEVIHAFINAYQYHAWFVLPAMLPILVLVTPMSYIFTIFAAANHMHGPAALGASIFLLPFVGAKYYTYQNNQAYDFSINQLRFNLFSEAGIIKPKQHINGLIFLPEHTENWQLVLENRNDQSLTTIQYKK